MSAHSDQDVIVAIYPYALGVAYTVFAGPLSPIDWGMPHVRGKERNARVVAIVRRVAERHHPRVIVLEEYRGNLAKRRQRMTRLNRMLCNYAAAEGIEIWTFARCDVNAAFGILGARTRYEIARTLADQIHAFADKLPAVRRCWMDQDPRMNLFNAASLAWTYYEQLDRAN